MSLNRLLSCLLVFSSFITSVFAQKETPSYSIKESSDKITIDGRLDEEVWKRTEKAGSFYISVPIDTSYAQSKTEVMMTYDSKFIYVAAICHESQQGEHIIQSLKRDFSYPRSDAFAVFIDPFNDKTNGFSFSVNPKGVQREGLIQGGGNFGVTTAWDNIWFSAVSQEADKWMVEMAIPFNSIRFKEGGIQWGINFSRNDLKINEGSSWSPVPRNFNIATLNYCGRLIWDKPLAKPKKYVAVIPYVSGGLSKNYDPDEEVKPIGNAGLDAKIAVSSSLQLDLTINPDFSQVEVDVQQTNLSRFSLFFPERRNFFIENSDLFANFGFRQIRPFFSRRIGLQNGSQIPILAGARLSGKVGDDWRIGVMNMQTDRTSEGLGQNFTVAAIQRQLGKSSNLSFIGINRMDIEKGRVVDSSFNRVFGLDYNFASASRSHMGKVFFHKSFDAVNQPKDYAHASWYIYQNRNLRAMWNHEYVGENYNAGVGFVPRIRRFNPIAQEVELKSYWRLEPLLSYRFYQGRQNFIIYHGPSIYMDYYANDSFSTTDNLVRARYEFQFRDRSELSLDYNERFTRLFFDTDVTFTDTTAIAAGEYNYSDYRVNFEGNSRRKLWTNFSFQTGEYYNGKRNNVSADLSYRKQPIGIFSLSVNYNSIQMPHLDAPVNITLLGAKAEMSFTKSIFFTTFLQYNTQVDNVNINSRLQWRYRPLSDLYLVYSENYLASEFDVKNRALLLKFIYWFQ